MHKVLLILLLTAVSTYATAGDKNNLGRECLPSGVVAIAKEKINPLGFWRSQVSAINNDMKNYKEQRHWEILTERQESEKQALEQKHTSEMLAMSGVRMEQYKPDPETERALAEIRADQSRGDEYHMQWYMKCLAYSKIKAGIK